MATVTLNTIAKRLTTEHGGHVQDLNFVAQVERWGSDMYREILAEWNWPWRYVTDTLTTVASTPSYQLDPTVDEIRVIQLAGSYDRRLDRVTIQDLVDSGADLALDGIPECWYVTGYNTSAQEHEITFWPIPNDEYTIYIDSFLRPSDLSSSSVIPFPEDFYTPLLHGIRACIARFDKEYDLADRYEAKYKISLEKLRKKYATIEADRPTRPYNDVRDTPRPHYLTRMYPRIW